VEVSLVVHLVFYFESDVLEEAHLVAESLGSKCHPPVDAIMGYDRTVEANVVFLKNISKPKFIRTVDLKGAGKLRTVRRKDRSSGSPAFSSLAAILNNCSTSLLNH
jgi:hypothetical protein